MKACLIGPVTSCIILLALSSCEAIFSTSALSWAQRDPSSLSLEQKLTYAQDALASGDEASMKKAYDSLKTTSDNSLKPLVAELAFGAAGVTQAMTDIMGDLINSSSEAQIESAINQLLAGFSADDVALIVSGSALVDAAAAGGAALTANQYMLAGVGMLVKAAKDNGDNITAILTSVGTPGEAAKNYLISARNLMGPGSQAYDILNTFQGYF
jgi:ferritin-like metal-binding protein YciE